jgi:hypothetical protein
MAATDGASTRSFQIVARVALGLLLVHALYVVLTAPWPEAAVLAFLLAVWYDVRASETLRRVHGRLFGPTARARPVNE